MARAAEVRASPASAEAEAWAPQAHARALELEASAERALDAGDGERAALLAEHAIAAHEHAWVLTRLARAERRRLDAEAELGNQRRALEDLQAQHQRLSAEAAGLELRAQAARAARPLPPHEASSAERQEARRRAAAALSAQARLLCVAARLLGEGARVEPILRRVEALERQAPGGSGGNTLDVAAGLRAECLSVIADARHASVAAAARAAPALGAEPASPSAPGPSGAPGPARAGAAPPVMPADVLLDELSAAGASPARDERGVAVSLRGVLGSDGELSEAARAELARLAKVGSAHPEFPVLLVGHEATPPRGALVIERQLQLVQDELVRAGITRVEAHSIGDRQPLLPARSPSARERNQRIELVFVAPGF